MTVERFFIEDDLKEGLLVTLTGEELHHLAHVIRMQVKEQLELVNGKGVLALGYIEKLDKKGAMIRIQKISTKTHPKSSITLALALPRFNRLEYIIEKTSELGVDHFIFFSAQGSEKKELSSNQWQRLHHLSIAALKQCGRLFLPSFSFYPNLESLLPEEDRQVFFGDTSPQAPLLTSIELKSSLFFIGPEKGFSKQEILFLKEKQKAKGISLSRNTLRVDTAAIALVTLASYFRLRLSPLHDK